MILAFCRWAGVAGFFTFGSVMAKKKSQVEKFRDAAREAGTDDSEDAFNAMLKGLAKHLEFSPAI